LAGSKLAIEQFKEKLAERLVALTKEVTSVVLLFKEFEVDHKDALKNVFAKGAKFF